MNHEIFHPTSYHTFLPKLWLLVTVHNAGLLPAKLKHLIGWYLKGP